MEFAVEFAMVMLYKQIKSKNIKKKARDFYNGSQDFKRDIFTMGVKILRDIYIWIFFLKL